MNASSFVSVRRWIIVVVLSISLLMSGCKKIDDAINSGINTATGSSQTCGAIVC